ncbi:MAG: type II toxin-antitoxin system RelE/ParE family toxin [Patescibacteria group bacterium]|jgi:phage-related protein
MEVKFFKQLNGCSPVKDFIINDLQPSDQKRVKSAIRRVYEQSHGLNNLFKAGYVKKLEKDIYELKPDRLRILFTIKDEICWLLHIFFKKSKKTPIKELDVARQRKNIIYNN